VEQYFTIEINAAAQCRLTALIVWNRKAQR
jgi:hypothetical protein